MYNPDTSRIHTTRDVKWLGRVYYKNLRFHTSKNLRSLESGKGTESDSYIEVENYDSDDV